MEKVLEKKPVKRATSSKVDLSMLAIERLTALNSGLVEKVQLLSREIDDLKNRIDQVASRLGL
jgi:hypothetical protein